MSVSNMKAISLLAFVLVNCEFVFSRPHPENSQHFAKRDIYFSNAIFNSVFRNRNPEQGLMRKFLGDDGSDITNNDDYYVIRIPIDDNSADSYVDQNENDRETSVEVMDENPDKNPINQETSTEVMSRNSEQNSIGQETTTEVISQNPDTNSMKEETSLGVTGQNADQNPDKQETTTEFIGQNPDINQIKEETSTEVIGQNLDQNTIKQETSIGGMDQNQDQIPIKEETFIEVMDQNTDEKPFKEILQVSGDLETPAQTSIVIADEPVSLKVAEKYDTNASKYTTENIASKTSKGCVPRLQSEIAIHEQKILTYFTNLVEPGANQNKTNVLNPCRENETVIDAEKKSTINSTENSKQISNKTSQELTNQLNFEVAPLASQPNTLVRDNEVEDYYFLFEEEQAMENNLHNGTNNFVLEEVSPPSVPIILSRVVSSSNIIAKNQSNPDVLTTRDTIDIHASNEASSDGPDFDIGFPVPIIPYKSTPKPQNNSELSNKIYESEISKEKKEDIEKIRKTTYPDIVEAESDATLKLTSTQIVSESEENKRKNRSTNLLVEKSNITERIGHPRNTIKTQNGKGFISDTIKFIEENNKALNTKSEPTDKASTIAKYIQTHQRNLTNEDIEKFSKDVLQLWKSNEVSGNRKTLSTNKPNVSVNKEQNYKRPNRNGKTPLKNSPNEVSDPGLRTKITHGISVPKRRKAVPKRGTPVIRRGKPTIRRGTPTVRSGTAVTRRGTSAPSRGKDQDGLVTSILSRVLQAVLRNGNQIQNAPKRLRRDLGPKKNKYVLKSIARKFFAPKYFPKSDGKTVFAVPGGSAVDTLPANFRQRNYESIQRNLVDSNFERKEVITLADIFNGDYLRSARSNKSKDYSEEFEQIM